MKSEKHALSGVEGAKVKSEKAEEAISNQRQAERSDLQESEGPNRVTKSKPGRGVRTCRICGCTDMDCSQCIEKTGSACYWVEPNLCSACENEQIEALEKKLEIINSGHAGLDRDGNIVDRRENPEAVAIKENKMMGNPKPKKGKS